MSSPARDERLLSIALGYTQVHHRGSNSISMRNPTTNKIRAVYGVGHGWHYGAGLETDTAWVTGVAPWNYQITKANYNLFALSQLNQGQILKWLDPASGQSITFQPMALQWTNSLNQIQQISMPQSAAAQASDDVLYWPAAYGSGRNFRYQASPLRLAKQLIIDSPLALPATSYDTLELNFIIAVSNGVNIMVDGAVWDKKTTKNTASAIAFQLPGGAVLWSFAVPTAWDSSGDPITGFTTGSMSLKKQGSSLYVSVRFPKSWIDSVPSNAWPIYIDPTVDYQVGASADDGMWDSETTYKNNGTMYSVGNNNTTKYYLWSRFPSCTISSGATIDVAYVSAYNVGRSGSPVLRLYAIDNASPTAPTSNADAAGRTKTTAYVDWTPGATTGWVNTPDIKTIVQELVDSYSGYSSEAIVVYLLGTQASSTNTLTLRQYDYTGNGYGPKLYIEYTEAAAGGTWAGTWGG